MSKRCAVCGKSYRGAGSLVYAAIAGEVKRVRACGPCASSAMRVIVGRPTAVAPLACGHAADTCGACRETRDKRADLETIARAFEGRAKAYRAFRGATDAATRERGESIAEVFDNAAAFVRSGRW